MTDHRQDPTAARRELDRFRDDFGRSLVAAARDRESPRPVLARPRRRRAALGLVAAGAVGVLVVTALPTPGDRDAPLLGASPAEAAVQQLRRSLADGVLVRRAETAQFGRTVERTTQEDWTDLATRQQHVVVTKADPQDVVEYWNPSSHERWTRTGKRAADGRSIVEHAAHDDAENTSSVQSPTEEVDELLQRAKDRDLHVLRTTVVEGAKVVVLEQRQRCYATRDGLAVDCPDPEEPSPWPAGAPSGMRPVTTFQTWWLQQGDAPKLLRTENGSVPRGSTKRDVVYRERYTRWDVLPTTPRTLSLVRPPAFPADRFLVVEG